MKNKGEIEQLAEQWCTNVSSSEKLAYKDGYTQCQVDRKQVLLDFIKWADAVDEFGEPLNENDIDNFLNK